jgi:hypothetical protein
VLRQQPQLRQSCSPRLRLLRSQARHQRRDPRRDADRRGYGPRILFFLSSSSC